MNKKIKDTLSEMKGTSPNIAVSTAQSCLNISEILTKIIERQSLNNDEINQVETAFAVGRAYISYTLPLLEPITYCSLDDVKLVGKATFEDLKKLEYSTVSRLNTLRDLCTMALHDVDRSDVHHYMRQFEIICKDIESEFHSHLLGYRHPYQ
jgi:hypothetical protein